MDETNCIYGINLDDRITPVMVRDAIIECFYQVDKKVFQHLISEEDNKSLEEIEEEKKEKVRTMIEGFFSEVKGDFNNPTKESLIKVINQCRDFAKNHRNMDIIEKHYNEIFTLINNIE